MPRPTVPPVKADIHAAVPAAGTRILAAARNPVAKTIMAVTTTI
jgi:hypothetical protein